MCYVLRPLTEKYKAKFDGEPVVSREFMDGDKVLIEEPKQFYKTLDEGHVATEKRMNTGSVI